MLHPTTTLGQFEAALRREPVDHAERLRLFDLLLAEARALGVIPAPFTAADIEHDSRYAQRLQRCGAPGRARP